MVNNLVGVRWDQSLSEVERSQTGSASSGMLVEGLEGGSDSQRVNCRRKPYVGSTQPGEVGVVGLVEAVKQGNSRLTPKQPLGRPKK